MAETESLRCESVPPAPQSRLSNRTGAAKFQQFVLEALIAKRFSGMVKSHLENSVSTQLDELVRKRFTSFMCSMEYKQHLVEIMHTVFSMATSYRASPDEINSHVSPPMYQLQFQTQPIPNIYANRELGELLGSIEVALVDANGNVVCTGKEASATLELIVLDADLSESITTLEEFRKAEQKPRENRPLLKGKTFVQLDNGKGMVDPSLCFTDNSSWKKKKQFRLGLVPVSTEILIRGAKTTAFTVLHHRSEANQKSVIPKSTDEVWRLNSVSKGGLYHKKLQEININTVQDFIECVDSKPDEIQKIFSKDQHLKAVILHARKCNTAVHGTCYTEVSQYSNSQGFIREEDSLAQEAIKSPNPSVSNPIPDLVGSSTRLFSPSGTTCLADTPVTMIQCFDQAQEFPLIGPVFADSNISTDHSNMDVQGMITIHSEVENVRGQELEAEGYRIQQGHTEINNLLCRPGGELYTNVTEVSSPSRDLRRRVPSHDQLFRLMRTRIATHDRPSTEVSSLQELPCHGRTLIGAELPDLSMIPEFTYNGIYPEICNRLTDSNLSTVPMESSSGAFAFYRSDQNMAHPSTNLDYILPNMFSGEDHRDNSQIENLTQNTLATLNEGLMEDMYLLDSSVAINYHEHDSFTTGSSNESTDMLIWEP